MIHPGKFGGNPSTGSRDIMGTSVSEAGRGEGLVLKHVLLDPNHRLKKTDQRDDITKLRMVKLLLHIEPTISRQFMVI